MLRIIRYLLAGMLLVIVASGCSHTQGNNDVLFQVSTINALLEGVYDGETTFQELERHGDFGIGTFNGLDGEMIGLDGDFYQIKADGVAYPVPDSAKTPFAVVTFFESDKAMLLNETVDYEQLNQRLDSLLPTKSIFYAFKIVGTFEYVKTRSVPAQKKPYPKLVEVVKNQPTFEFHNVKGTMVGFRCPAYVEGINVPGYHIHFITEDRKAGGHLLKCRMKAVDIMVDYTSSFYMVLPKGGEFHKVNLADDKRKELEKVEK